MKAEKRALTDMDTAELGETERNGQREDDMKARLESPLDKVDSTLGELKSSVHIVEVGALHHRTRLQQSNLNFELFGSEFE